MAAANFRPWVPICPPFGLRYADWGRIILICRHSSRSSIQQALRAAKGSEDGEADRTLRHGESAAQRGIGGPAARLDREQQECCFA